MIKAVITAAGRGTRLLPMTKEMPKEMMPVFSKIYGKNQTVIPLLQLIFDQIYSCNIRNFCFVIGRGKRSIEDHFTPDFRFLEQLSGENKKIISKFYYKIKKSNLIWVNQFSPLGFGDAVRTTEEIVGNDDFIVHAGDVSIIGHSKHPIARLIEAAKDSSVSAVLLVKKVKDPKRHGIAKLKKISNSKFFVEQVEEKPSRPKSNIGLMPLYFFRPSIFKSLNRIKRGKGNEFQLTDAIQKLIEDGQKVLAIPVNKNEISLDVGTVESYWASQNNSYKHSYFSSR